MVLGRSLPVVLGQWAGLSQKNVPVWADRPLWTA